jgi:hypothetical protein
LAGAFSKVKKHFQSFSSHLVVTVPSPTAGRDEGMRKRIKLNPIFDEAGAHPWVAEHVAAPARSHASASDRRSPVAQDNRLAAGDPGETTGWDGAARLADVFSDGHVVIMAAKDVGEMQLDARKKPGPA